MASPPSPRLVCVETNPGPKSPVAPVLAGTSLLKALVDIVSSKKNKKVLMEETKTKQKKNKKPVENRRPTPLQYGNMARVVQTVPVSSGVVRRSASTHTPFIVKGSCLAGYMMTSSANLPVLANSDGTVSVVNLMDVDPLGTSAVSTNFKSFPSTFQNIATSFSRYRLRSLKCRFSPTCSTATPLSIAVCSNPETTGTGSASTNVSTITSSENNYMGPVWSPFIFDMMAYGGLRNEWLFCDTNATAEQGQLRQESAGLFAAALIGTSTVSQTYGAFFWEFEIEFEGLIPENVLGVSRSVIEPTNLCLPSSSLPTPAQHDSQRYQFVNRM